MASTRVLTNFGDNDTILRDGSDYEVIGKVSLDSGDMGSLVVGIFENEYPQPSYHIEVEPQTVAVSSSLVRVDDNGEYKLTYHFQNFQDKPCEVTVRRCDND